MNKGANATSGLRNWSFGKEEELKFVDQQLKNIHAKSHKEDQGERTTKISKQRKLEGQFQVLPYSSINLINSEGFFRKFGLEGLIDWVIGRVLHKLWAGYDLGECQSCSLINLLKKWEHKFKEQILAKFNEKCNSHIDLELCITIIPINTPIRFSIDESYNIRCA